MSSRFRTRSTIGLTILILLSLIGASLHPEGITAQGTPEASAVEDPNAFMPGDGLTSSLIGQADVDLGSMGDPTLRLEQIDLPVGTTLPNHTATVSEILYVDAGAVAIADGFGFTTETAAGQQLIFNPGTSYDLQQAGDQAARVLRVRVAGINEPLLDTATTDQSIDPSGATPVSSEPTIMTIIDHRLTEVSETNATYYLARLALAPGAETGEQSHDGPLGLYVTSGSLSALSPSGATGTLSAGASAVLPADVALIGSNQGADDAVVFLVGLGAQGGPLVVEITPTPVPTIPPTPTPTLEPTPTSQPTPTVPPTPTVEPSPTPTPTPEPSPSPIPTPTIVPVTVNDMILQLGESWITDSGSLRVSLVDVSTILQLEAVYTNTSDSRLDFTTTPDLVSVYDDLGAVWSVETSNLSTIDLGEGQRIILDPGESLVWDFTLSIGGTSAKDYVANIFLNFRNLGTIEAARWGFTLYDGRALSLPPNAIDPQIEGTPTISTAVAQDTSKIGWTNVISEDFLGTWEGTLVNVNNEDWDIQIVLTGGEIGQVVGTVDYPARGCEGRLTLVEVAPSSIQLSESLDDGDSPCLMEATHMLYNPASGKLNFQWSGTVQTKSAILSRVE